MQAISAILGKGYCGESAESLRGRGGTCAKLLYGVTVTNGNLVFPHQDRPDPDDGQSLVTVFVSMSMSSPVKSSSHSDFDNRSTEICQELGSSLGRVLLHS